MSKNMLRLIICLLMSISVTVEAQNTSEAKLYGKGVHAYNNGEYDTALDFFNAGVDQGTEDPRVFLFRGLVYHHQGKTKESLADLTKGAELEAVDKRGFYPVSPALIQVQGKIRIQIEIMRREARNNLIALEKTRAAARYEQQKANETTALRKPMPKQAPVVPLDAQQTVRRENPFAPDNISGIKNNPSNVTVSEGNPTAAINDKDPLANLNNDKPMPPNPKTNNKPPAGNNPFAPGNNTPPADNKPPAGNNPFAPGNNTSPADNKPPADNNPFNTDNTAPGNNNSDKENKNGGTLGAIFGSLNPFGGGNVQPDPNEGNIPTSLDEIKKLIQGNLPDGDKPAPDSKNPSDPLPNPFK